jgi:exonuclease SbcD
MPRILHAADLHLSESEKDYGLSVFAELIDVARRERVDYLVFCGDLFNTFTDAEKLRADFRRIMGSPPFEFLYLPGNHEELQSGSRELAHLDWGAATVLNVRPFELLRRDRGGMPIEFLAVPHQEQYAGYGNWAVPSKNAGFRIALAHGVVAGMSFRGPDEEGGGAAIDPDLFARFQADYAALGHIHGRRCQTQGSVTMAYPGSSRVWRKNESGPRGAYLLEPGVSKMEPGVSKMEPSFIPFSSAGEYRHHSLPLTLEGEIPDLEGIASRWGAADYIELEFTGLVEDERIVARLAEGIRNRFGSRVRRLEIERDGVSALPGIASHPIVREFLAAWNLRKPAQADELPVWTRARELALNSLKTNLERRG